MHRNIYNLTVDRTWFGDTFDTIIFTFKPNTPEETTWALGRQLSERSHQSFEPYEAIAVFEAVQRSGPKPDCPALIKLHMQSVKESFLKNSTATTVFL